MVRNSIGSGELALRFAAPISSLIVYVIDCYVADEIIKSTAGVRVRVGNTDAEGRMVMADLLCEAKDDVKAEHLILYQ